MIVFDRILSTAPVQRSVLGLILATAGHKGLIQPQSLTISVVVFVIRTITL